MATRTAEGGWPLIDLGMEAVPHCDEVRQLKAVAPSAFIISWPSIVRRAHDPLELAEPRHRRPEREKVGLRKMLPGRFGSALMNASVFKVRCGTSVLLHGVSGDPPSAVAWRQARLPSHERLGGVLAPSAFIIS